MVLNPPTKPNQVPNLRQRDVREQKIIVTKVTTTSYVSISPTTFHAGAPNTDQVSFAAGGTFGVNMADVDCFAEVNLPHGAIVTAVVTYSNVSDETWTLKRKTISTGSVTNMVSDNMNTENSTITNATIDNSTYSYLIETSSLDNTDDIYGARITYTTTS